MRLKKQFLFLSIILFLASCSHKTAKEIAVNNTPNNCLQQLKPEFKSVIYNTQVNVVGNHLSGLLLIKQMPGDTTRILFTSETGIKFFDFQLTNTDFKVVYCIKKLNKKIITTQLQKIFRLVLMNYGNLNNYTSNGTDSLQLYSWKNKKEIINYSTNNCTEVVQIETLSNKNKKKININLAGTKNGMADAIFIKYQTFSFDITLKQIDR
jgi:hypothetical protein